MIRFACLQFRTQAAVALLALAGVAAVVGLSGPQLIHLYNTLVAPCRSQGDCTTAAATFLRTDNLLQSLLGALVVVVPCIVGIFWGAPLIAAETEAGTLPLVWTQSVTRTRWLGGKLGVVGLASMAAAGLLSLLVTWWAAPLDRAGMNVYGTFDQRDIVPIGYAAFGFVLGVSAGLVTRRTQSAMAITLVGFVAVRLCFTTWIRPDFIAPQVLAVALDPNTTGYGSSSFLPFPIGPSTLQPAPPHIPNSWITSIQIENRAAQLLTSQVLNHDCPNLGRGRGGPPGLLGPGSTGGHAVHVSAAVRQRTHACVAKIGATYHEAVTYQPASHYWALQWFETAIFMGTAALLLGFCLAWVGRAASR